MRGVLLGSGDPEPCAMAIVCLFVVMLWRWFIVFCIEGLVFVWLSVMHSPSVVSSLFGG